MSDTQPNITLPVDCENPGQFFACCGLLELADRLWPGVEGWFLIEPLQCRFQIAAAPEATLKELLANAQRIEFDLRCSEGDEDNAPIEPVVLTSPVTMLLDWWSDKSIKPWAGSMKERLILHAMVRAINPASVDPFNDAKVVRDPITGKKREPFYFDCRRGCNAHPIDSGFSADTVKLESECVPAVESMCFIGLQRARPFSTGELNRSRYVVWTKPLPVNALAPVVCGLAAVRSSLVFAFDNFFRTDQRKHKCFSRARRERSRND